ncbi:MAG: two-component regulator propeller domain-containing protein [Prolixibacteraceae bacterium]
MKATLTTLLMFVFSVHVIAQRLNFDHLTIEDGLANNSVRTVFQDKEGYLWFGTLNGLSRYDGQQFKTFAYQLSDSTSIGNNKIREIFQDGLGYIWVTTYDNNVHRFDPANENFINFPAALGDNLGDNLIHFAVETSPGVVWLYLSGNGCVRVVSQANSPNYTFTHYTTENGLLSNSLNGIWVDQNDQIWLSTMAGFQQIKTKGASIQFTDVNYFTSPALNVVTFSENNDALWLGTQSGEIYRIKDDQPKLIWKLEAQEVDIRGIRQMEPFSGNQLIAATENGIVIINAETGKTTHYTVQNSRLNSNYVISIFIDKQQGCWLVTDERGVTYFDVETGNFTHYPLHPEIRQSIVEGEKQVFLEDQNGDVWVGIYGGGIARFNQKTRQFDQFLHDENNPSSISSNLILSIFQDRSGNMLVGTYQRGVNIINLEERNFHQLKGMAGVDGDFSNEVRAVFEDHRKWIWTGNKRGEVLIYDQNFNLIFNLNEVISHDLIQTGVYSFEEDQYHNLWIGTKGNGIYVLKNLPENFTRGFLQHVEIVHITTSTEVPFSIAHNNVFDLHFDEFGQLWIALYHGGVQVIQNPLQRDQKISYYRHDANNQNSLTDNRVRCLMEDHSGNIWIGTSNGLNFVQQKQVTSKEKIFRSFVRSNDPGSLTYNDINSIYEDSGQQIWIGTLGGGINRLKSSEIQNDCRFEKVRKVDGLSSNMILGMVEDDQKMLWITTDFGLNKYNLENNTIENYFKADGLGEHSFSEGQGLFSSSGKLLFGDLSGMVWFEPSSITKSQQMAPLVLTSLKLNGEENKSKLNAARKILGDSIQSLKFKYNENFITFEFAALDYKAPTRIQYTFKLEKYEDNWNKSGNLNTAIYRDLPPGDYKFRLNASNSDGLWVNPELTLSFTIEAPPWKTTWAYSLYLVFFLSLFLLLQRFLMERVKLKHEVVFEKQLADDKLKFYTSISHEFKTPLALIMGPMDELLLSGKLNDSIVAPLKMMKRNTRRLQELIDQLMDFRKIQKGYLQSDPTTGDLIEFLNDIYLAFLPLSKQHQIEFLFKKDYTQFIVSLDFKSLEKIVFNLLSNAFKYTGAGKQITLKLEMDEIAKLARIFIIDEGEGIREKDLPHIFQRFNPGSRSRWNEDSSTGVGLSFCSELVEVMKGEITVQSQRDQGSTFTVCIPFGAEMGANPLSLEHKEISYTDKYIDTLYDGVETTQAAVPENKNQKREKILIVEDNLDMQQFLKNRLSVIYHVFLANNGLQGLEMARNENPDLILCDIMMPEMNGIELTQILKKEFYTSHIPVVLLSARSLDEQRIEGLEIGADDYIVKPFNIVYLETRIKNLLEQRKKLRERFKTDASVEVEELSMSVADQEFMDKIVHLIHQHMANADFKVETLLENFNYGRTVFYKKMNGITGYSPNDFIRIIRLRKAGELLLSNNVTVAEVAFGVGYSDTNYFTRIFKKHYGKTPSEYQKDGGANTERSN